MSLPDRALSNFDIEKAVRDLKIKKFCGVFMRDTLPKKALKNECGIVNLSDSSKNDGHWLCWIKRRSTKVFFDSYSRPPPNEMVKYLGNDIYYNSFQVKKDGWLCGHFSLYILAATNLSSESTLLKDAQDAINFLF